MRTNNRFQADDFGAEWTFSPRPAAPNKEHMNDRDEKKACTVKPPSKEAAFLRVRDSGWYETEKPKSKNSDSDKCHVISLGLGSKVGLIHDTGMHINLR